MATITLRPTSATGTSWSSIANAYDGSTTTSATVSVNNRNYSIRTATFNFDTSSIPSDATINGATLYVRAKAGSDSRITLYADINSSSSNRVINSQLTTTTTSKTSNILSYINSLSSVKLTGYTTSSTSTLFTLYEVYIVVDYTEGITVRTTIAQDISNTNAWQYAIPVTDWDNQYIEINFDTSGLNDTSGTRYFVLAVGTTSDSYRCMINIQYGMVLINYTGQTNGIFGTVRIMKDRLAIFDGNVEVSSQPDNFDYGSLSKVYVGNLYNGVDIFSGTRLSTIKSIEVVSKVKAYTVTFQDHLGNVLKTEKVPEGGMATPPTAPSRTGYVFTGWSGSYANIDSDRTLIAQYVPLFTVTFVDWDGTVLKTQDVQSGSSATPPSNPTRSGYKFTGWSGTYTNVSSSRTITAQYVAVYTVTFKDWDGTTLKTVTDIESGSSATPPANPTRDGYEFTGWNTSYTNVTSNLTVTAQYAKSRFTVTFVDWDGTTLKTEQVNKGNNATPPVDPVRDGYNFTGWSDSYTNITSDITITALYKEAHGEELYVYKFDNSIEDLFPTFNSGFEFTYEDSVSGTTTTRIIYSKSRPTEVSFMQKKALLEVHKFYTTTVTSLYGAFYQCTNLTHMDFTYTDFSSVISAEGMFNTCTKLSTIVGLKNLNVSKVNNMGGFFSGCSSLTELDVENWDVTYVTNFGAIFRGCSNVTTINVSKWNAKNAERMGGMFQGCSKLESLDLTGFDVKKVLLDAESGSAVAGPSQICYGCSSLTTINLSGWRLREGIVSNNMFANCSKLQTVIINDSDYHTINLVIASLPTRNSSSYGNLQTRNVSFKYLIDSATALAKYWNIEDLSSVADNKYVTNSNLSLLLQGVKTRLDNELVDYTTKDDLDNLVVGMRNLQRYSAPELMSTNTIDDLWVYGRGNLGTTTLNGRSWFILSMNKGQGTSYAELASGIREIPVEAGMDYTFSMDYIRGTNCLGMYIALYDSSDNFLFYICSEGAETGQGEIKHIEATWNSDITGTVYVTYYNGGAVNTNSADCTLYFSNTKIEKGTKATDWTPAPQDRKITDTQMNDLVSRIFTR